MSSKWLDKMCVYITEHNKISSTIQLKRCVLNVAEIQMHLPLSLFFFFFEI